MKAIRKLPKELTDEPEDGVAYPKVYKRHIRGKNFMVYFVYLKDKLVSIEVFKPSTIKLSRRWRAEQYPHADDFGFSAWHFPASNYNLAMLKYTEMSNLFKIKIRK